MKYFILADKDLDTLIEMVNEALADGWSLQGGVAISYARDGGYTTTQYAQAVTK